MTIYASFQSLPNAPQALLLWTTSMDGWVEIRGRLDESLQDPLQKVIDSLPASQVSGLMSQDICVFTRSYPPDCHRVLWPYLELNEPCRPAKP